MTLDGVFRYLRGLDDYEFTRLMEDIATSSNNQKDNNMEITINLPDDLQQAVDQGADKHAVLFGLMCDVVERAWQHWPVDSWEEDVSHTSDYARAGAARIWDALGLPYPKLTPQPEANVKAYRAKNPDDTDAGTVEPHRSIQEMRQNGHDQVVRFYGEGPFRIVEKPAGPTVAIGLFHTQSEADQALAEAGSYLGTSLSDWQNRNGFSLLIDPPEVTA